MNYGVFKHYVTDCCPLDYLFNGSQVIDRCPLGYLFNGSQVSDRCPLDYLFNGSQVIDRCPLGYLFNGSQVSDRCPLDYLFNGSQVIDRCPLGYLFKQVAQWATVAHLRTSIMLGDTMFYNYAHKLVTLNLKQQSGLNSNTSYYASSAYLQEVNKSE